MFSAQVSSAHAYSFKHTDTSLVSLDFGLRTIQRVMSSLCIVNVKYFHWKYNTIHHSIVKRSNFMHSSRRSSNNSNEEVS